MRFGIGVIVLWVMCQTLGTGRRHEAGTHDGLLKGLKEGERNGWGKPAKSNSNYDAQHLRVWEMFTCILHHSIGSLHLWKSQFKPQLFSSHVCAPMGMLLSLCIDRQCVL